MLKLVHITDVEVLGDHLLRLTFEDGVVGEVDYSDTDWVGVFEPMRDPKFFAQVFVDSEAGTIAWPNGVDVAPEPLYEACSTGNPPFWVGLRVTDVEHVGGCRVRIAFADGVVGEIDFSEERWLRFYEVLRDPDYIAHVLVDDDLGTVAWPDGLALARQALYDAAQPQPVR